MADKNIAERILPDLGYFSGRGKELAKIEALVAANKIVLLEGLSGIGKSALALRFAYQAIPDYDAILWYEIQPGDSAEAVVVNLASQLGDYGYSALLDAATDPQLDGRKRVNALIEALRQNHALLILDSFNYALDDTNRVGSYFAILLDQLLGQAYPSRILLTTKIKPQFSPTHLDKYKVYELQGFRDDDAAQFIGKLCADMGQDVDDSQAAQFVRAAGGHPFALKIIVGLLGQGYLLQNLLDQMRKRVVSDYGQFLLDILYARLSRGAKNLLEVCSVYRRPVSLAAIEKLPADARLMDQLLPCFLLELEPRGQRYFMHNIVREYAYDKLERNEDRRQKARKAAGDYYASIMGDPLRQRDFGTVQRVLEAQYHYREADDNAGLVNVAAYLADDLKPLVRKLYREGKHDSTKREMAGRLYQTILSMDEQDAEMHYYYGRLLEKQGGAKEEIERHYREAATIAPRVAEWQMRFIIFLVTAKKYGEARIAFQVAVKKCGHRNDLYVPYAKALREAGHLPEAAAVLQEGLKRVPPENNLYALYLAYSEVLRAQGQLPEAAAVLQEGLKRVPPEAISPLFVHLASILKELGRIDEANQTLREGIEQIKIWPGRAYLYVLLSANLRAQKKEAEADEAIVVLTQALDHLPLFESSLVHTDLAILFEQKGDNVKAEMHYDQSVKLGIILSFAFRMPDFCGGMEKWNAPASCSNWLCLNNRSRKDSKPSHLITIQFFCFIQVMKTGPARYWQRCSITRPTLPNWTTR